MGCSWLDVDSLTGFSRMLSTASPPPHAVPSLAGTPITGRTVMARMKIAEYNAVPALTGGLNFMESLGLHESICPLAEAGHYTPGGPLTAEEAKDEKEESFPSQLLLLNQTVNRKVFNNW